MNAQTIDDMLASKGVTAIVTTYPSATFDPDTNTTNRGTATIDTVNAIPPYKNKEGYKETELITSGKGLTGFANLDLSFTVAAGLLLTISSKVWTVISYQEIKDNTGILMYLCDIETGS